MKQVKRVLRLVFYNWKALAGFELVYKGASTLLFIPLIWGIFDRIMHFAGYSYLTLENIGSFLLNPWTIIALLLLFLLATTFAMAEISAIVFILDQAEQGRHVRFRQVLRFAVKNALRAWNPRNVLLVVVVLLLMPFLSLGMASSLLSSISIPEFIMDYILKRKLFAVLFALLLIGLSLLMMKWLYAFHYFTLEGCTFGEARKRSSNLSRRRRLRDSVTVFLVQAGFAVAGVLFVMLMISLTALVGKAFAHIFVLRWIISTIIWLIFVLSLAVLSAIATPVSYGCISILFYNHKLAAGERIMHTEVAAARDDPRRQVYIHRIGVVLSALIVIFSLVLGFLIYTGKLNPRIEYLRTTEVTAHRGASAKYPENTMAAFRGAKELGADWIELDVQQTKDGQIVVLHDTNVKRITGVNANTWELTYEEIAALDAGSSFHKKFAGEKIPLLSEAASWAAENHMKLNIELKPTGRETDFERCVIEIVKEAGIEEDCVITSQNYKVLERVKAIDESVQTVYVMAFAYGNIDRLTAADHFSVEAKSVTRTLVSRVHNAGKQIYAWTVNSENSIRYMISLGVDNVITDDPVLAKKCVNKSRYSSWLAEYLKWFEFE